MEEVNVPTDIFDKAELSLAMNQIHLKPVCLLGKLIPDGLSSGKGSFQQPQTRQTSLNKNLQRAHWKPKIFDVPYFLHTSPTQPTSNP